MKNRYLRGSVLALGVALGVLLALATFALMSTQVVGQVPGLPMRVFGVVYINDVAQNGMLVEARIDDTVVATTTSYADIQGEEVITGFYRLAIYGGQDGDDVHFFVEGVEAEESPHEWRNSSPVDDFDLHIGLAELSTTVSAPRQVEPGSEFVVTAAVSNTGQADALGVSASITHTTGAGLVSGTLVQDVGAIPASSQTVLSWTLACLEAVPVTVTVAASGTDSASSEAIASEDAATVDQHYVTYLPLALRSEVAFADPAVTVHRSPGWRR